MIDAFGTFAEFFINAISGITYVVVAGIAIWMSGILLSKDIAGMLGKIKQQGKEK